MLPARGPRFLPTFVAAPSPELRLREVKGGADVEGAFCAEPEQREAGKDICYGHN